MTTDATISAWQRAQPLLRLLRDYFLSRRLVAISCAFIGLVAATDLLGPWLVMKAIDTIVGQYHAGTAGPDAAAFSRVLGVAGVMVALICVQYVSHSLLVRTQNRMMYQGAARLRSELYGRLQAQPLAFHTQRRVGNLLTSLVTDIQVVQDMSLELISRVPFDLCVLSGLLLVMFLVNAVLALGVAGFLLGALLVGVRLGRQGWHSQERAMDATAAFTSRVQESLSGIRTIQSFGAASQEHEGVAELSGQQALEMQEAGQVHATVTPFFGLSEYAGILLVLVVGGWCALHGTLTAGGLVAFLAYMEMAAEPIARIAELLPKAQKAMVAARRVGTSLAETAAPAASTPTVSPASITGEVRIHDLGFAYPGGKLALHGVNVTVMPGEKVAVIGANAAGKSTLFDLLLKLQSPTQGTIEVDGIDLRNIVSQAWCSLVGVVPQDIVLLNRTIAENIALGAADLSDVQQAARQAGVHDAILRLPKGYDTLPGERGVCLSGGQRQRIAIARVFLRNPRILLLDEPTAALDLRSEAALLPPLATMCRGRTTFIVSHRTAVLEEVDKVLLLADGRQLAFDTPRNVWRDFPQYRLLFPPAWEAARHSVEPVAGRT